MSPTGPGKETDGCQDCGDFLIDATGAYGPQAFAVRWSNRRRASNEQIDRLIDQTWAQELASAEKTGKMLFDGKLCRLIRWSSSQDGMSLTLGPVTFREFIGTNANHPELHYRHGPEVLANPLGVSAAIVSADGFILLGRRSDRVAVYPGRIHPIGGIMDYDDGQPAVPDPFEVMLREVGEETGLPRDAVRGVLCLGMVRDKLTLQPELVFEVSAARDVPEILASTADAADAVEHSELLHVGNNPSAVVAFIERNRDEMTPLATATLLLHGLHHWGCGWFATAKGYLSGAAGDQGGRAGLGPAEGIQ